MTTLPGLPRVLLVTGTDTEVGKTVTTAALAVLLSAAGTVAVYKPVQTGVAATESGDAAEVGRLCGIDSIFEGVRFREPMAPLAAAECDGRALPALAYHARQIEALSARYDWVLVEGSGGALVQLDRAGATLADLPAELSVDSGAVLVARSGLGTLNHTALTVEALANRWVATVGVVVGSLPKAPGLVEQSNLRVLAAGQEPLWGAIPAGAARLAPSEFQASAGAWLGSGLTTAGRASDSKPPLR